MIKLDENLLVELGLGNLPKPEKTAFLKHMYETLEMRVGTRLAERMTDQQMSEFEQFINSNDEQGAFHWLETNFPNYKEVVAEEFEKLKTEIRPLAEQITAASQAQAQAQSQGQAQPGSQPAPGVGQPSAQTSPAQPFTPAPSPQFAQPQPQAPFGQPAAAPASDFQPPAYGNAGFGPSTQPPQQANFGQPVVPASNPASDMSPFGSQPFNPAPSSPFGQQPAQQSQPFSGNDSHTPSQYGQPQPPTGQQSDQFGPGPAPSFGQPGSDQQPPAFGGPASSPTPPPVQPPSPFGPPPQTPPAQ